MPVEESTQTIKKPLLDLNGLKLRVVLALILLTFTLSFLRYLFSEENVLPAGDSAWQITLTVDVNFQKVGSKMLLPHLWNTQHVRVIGKSIQHPGMSERRLKKDEPTRDIVLLSTNKGPRSIKLQFDVYLSHQSNKIRRLSLNEDDRKKWLSPSDGIPVDEELIQQVLRSAAQTDLEADELVKTIFDHMSERIKIFKQASHDGAIAYKNRAGSELGANRSLIAAFRSAHLPAREVIGLDLTKPNLAQPYYWSEVYYSGKWHVMDIVAGVFDQLQPQLIPIRRGDIQVVQVEEAVPVTAKWSILQVTSPVRMTSSNVQNILQILDLSRISPSGRDALALLVLLPIGVLVTEFLRQIIGIRTFGTFTPTLLALAAVYVDFTTSVVIFALVIIFGVAGRALLSEISLSRVARLSIVFTMVATIMLYAVSTLIFFNPTIDTAVVLLPIVILTTLVDSFYSVADDKGLPSALKRLAFTAFAALFSMMVLLQSHWGHELLMNPEFHFATIALIILLGSYQGTRVSDIGIFNWIREKPSSKTNNRKTHNDSEND